MNPERKEVSIVTSLLCEIPRKKLVGVNIGLIDGYVNLGGKSYRERAIPKRQFRAGLKRKPLPTTSAPNPHDFSNIYKERLKDTNHVFSIHTSSKLTSTINNAKLAANMENLPVTVFDSQFIGMAEGFIALEAARIADLGGSIDEVIKSARRAQANVGLAVLAYPQKPMIESRRFPGAGDRIAGKTVFMFVENGTMKMGDIFNDPYKANKFLVEWCKKQVGSSQLKVTISSDYRVDQNLVNDLFVNSRDLNIEEISRGSESPHYAVHLGKAIRFAYLVNGT